MSRSHDALWHDMVPPCSYDPPYEYEQKPRCLVYQIASMKNEVSLLPLEALWVLLLKLEGPMEGLFGRPTGRAGWGVAYATMLPGARWLLGAALAGAAPFVIVVPMQLLV